MRILHISSPLTWRGGEQQLAYLIDELRERGIDQEVLCADGSAVESFCRNNKVTCYTFNKNILQIVSASIINEICVNDNISLIHTHDAHSHSAAVLSSMIFGNSTPIIVSRRTNFPICTNWFSKVKYNHSSVSRIVCVSEKIKEQVSKSINEKSKIVTVYSGIDLMRFKNNNVDALRLSSFGDNLTHPFIGNIAALTEEKDFFTFVNTADVYFKSTHQGTFFIIGDGPYRSQIESYISKKGLKDKIIFTGFQQNIAGIMKQLDCLLFTSHSEGLGTTILDAMACRIPVVATRTGGIPEIVINGYTGLLAPVKNADILARCLIKITRDHFYRRMLVRSANAHVYNFTKQKMALQTLDIYHQVLYERSLASVPVLQPSLLSF